MRPGGPPAAATGTDSSKQPPSATPAPPGPARRGDGRPGTGASVTRRLSPGTHTSAATVTDSSNVPASATAVVTVTASGGIGFRDFTSPVTVGTGMPNEATAQKPEGCLWFLDGTWW